MMNHKSMLFVCFLTLSLLTGSFSWALVSGDALPVFSTKNQDGKLITSDTVKGKPALFYFYPKDDTPGCTKEACAFRDGFAKFKAKGIFVFGISSQDLESHKKFATKFHLPFDLLDDTSGTLVKLFGVDQMPIVGLYKRQSVLIGANGKVLKIYKDVKPEAHADEVLHDLETL